MYRDTPPDLRWALLSPLTLGRRWLLRAIMPGWLRQPQNYWLKLRRRLRTRGRRTRPTRFISSWLFAGYDG
jgi:hypothetical protein